jgi:hypothetical protein
MNFTRSRIGFIGLVVACVASACGGGGGEPSAGAPPADTSPPAGTSTATTRPVVVDVDRRREFKREFLRVVEGASAQRCVTADGSGFFSAGGGPIVLDAATGLVSSSLGSIDLLAQSSGTFLFERNYVDGTMTIAIAFGSQSTSREFFAQIRDGMSSVAMVVGGVAVSCPSTFNAIPDLAVLFRRVFTATRVPMRRCSLGLSPAAADVTVDGLTIAARGLVANLASADKRQETYSFEDTEASGGALSYTGSLPNQTINLRVDDSGYLRTMFINGGTLDTLVTCERPAG